MTLAAALAEGEEILRAAGIEDARHEALLLIERFARVPPASALASREREYDGPALLDADGKSTEIRHALAGPNPRTAIGYYEPGHYCFVVVDGRGESFGISLNNLSILMHDLGCVAAYNLDGGASAQMYWNGAIINAPSGKNRAISDIIYLLAEE